MSDFVPTPGQLEKWDKRRRQVKLARGEYAIRAKDAAQLEHERLNGGILGILEAHPDWAHAGDDNMVFCVGCDYEEAPVNIDDAPRKFREHQARMIPANQTASADAKEINSLGDTAAKLGIPLEVAEQFIKGPSDREFLIECLFRGYKTLGFDTDGDKTGMEMLARTGLGGNNLDEFIRIMDRAFAEAREEMDGAA